MKCIKIEATKFGTVADNGIMVIRRVDDDTAFDLVHRGDWQYAPRSEWKAAGRKWGLKK